jgi:quercetin dioxygenase-like cupin family protein
MNDPTPAPLTRRQAARLGAALAALAAVGPTGPARADEPSLRGFDDVEPIVFPWGWIRWLMNDQVDPAAEMTLGVVQIEAHQANPLHLHPNSVEYLHVLSGTCAHRVGDRWVDLKAGDTLRVPAGVAHSARTREEACRVLVVYDTGRRQMVTLDEPAPAP